MSSPGRDRSQHRKSFQASQQPKLKMNRALVFFCVLIVFLLVHKWSRMDDLRLPASENHEAQENKLIRNHSSRQLYQKQSQFIFLNKPCSEGNFEVRCIEKEMLMLQKLVEIISQQHRNDSGDINSSPKPEKSSSAINRPIGLEQHSNIYQQLLEYPLQAVKNIKLTTPKTKSDHLLQSLKHFFYPFDPYQGLDQMLQTGRPAWQIDTKYAVLTVRANRELTPQLIQIDLDTEKSQQIFLVGLLFTIQNELVAVKLGNYHLNPGLNLIQCSSQPCNQQYPMILFKVTKMKINTLKIYEKKYL